MIKQNINNFFIFFVIFIDFSSKTSKIKETFGAGLIVGFLIFYFLVNSSSIYAKLSSHVYVVISIIAGFCLAFILKEKKQFVGIFLTGFTISMFFCFLFSEALFQKIINFI